MWAAFCGPVFSSLLYAGRLAPQVSLERISAREVMETNFPPDAQVLPSSYQAQIALYQLERLGALTAARQRIARFYDHRLREESFTTFTYSVTPTWTRYPLAVSDRAKVMSAFAKENLQLGWFLRYTCEDVLNVKSKSPLCRNARAWAQSMINLPNWPGIAMADAERCVSLLLRLRDHDGQALAWPMVVT
jgi:dTDP-4-amino-4,6-dideoxygalactose transaminase